MTAKATALGRAMTVLTSEAKKEVVSSQETMRALATGAQAWLETEDDEEFRRDFFARIEAAVSPAVAKKIERHPLRPASVGPIVEAAREKVEAQKQAQKAEADRAKEERERQKLAELKARYEDKPTAKTQPAAETSKAAD